MSRIVCINRESLRATFALMRAIKACGAMWIWIGLQNGSKRSFCASERKRDDMDGTCGRRTAPADTFRSPWAKCTI